MERTAFLNRLRAKLAHEAPPNIPHPLVHIAEIPKVRYDQDLDDPVAAFTRNAMLQGAQVQHVASLDDFLSRVVEAEGAGTVVMSGDPETQDVGETMRRLGLDVLPFDGPQPAADLGIAGGAHGIAATGTVVFDAARAGGRSASLLPPAIAILLNESAIVADAGDVFRRMIERFPDGLPSQLVLCTGPSKSGDIELELTTGVHGPGRVWIGLLPR
jgi:L-lactate utilization protein LutC